MNTFKASTQHNNLQGSSAADVRDWSRLKNILKEKSHINISDDEYIIGISIRIGENYGKYSNTVNVTFLISRIEGYKNVPEMLELSDTLKAKEICIDMEVKDIFKEFSELELTLSHQGLLEGKYYKSN